MEAFTVTGSNIKRAEEEKILPVTVMNRDDLDLSGASTAAEIFATLSIGGPIVLDEGNLLGADARGDNNSINLRGIGSGNTLILLNGRRLPPHPISQAESGVPSLSANVNNLPAAAISRVEVLRDGASAIYGTDAAAGVVNSITRSNFDGLSFRGRGSATQHGGAGEYSFEVTDGRNFNGGKSNLLVTLDFLHRDALGAWDRKFSRSGDVRTVRDVPPPFDGRPLIDSAGNTVNSISLDNRLSTGSSNYGNFVRGSYDATGTFVGSRPTGNRGIVTASGSNNMTTSTAGVFYGIPLADGTVGFRQTLPSHVLSDYTVNWYYNVSDYRFLVPKTDRLNLTSTLRHKLSEKVEAFGEILAYKARSITGREPAAFDAATDHNIYVSANNPYNPFGSRFYEINGLPNADGTPRLAGAPADVQIAPSTGVRPRDFKARIVTVDSEAVRGVAGLRGKLRGDWEWESAVLYGRNTTHDEEQFAVRESRLRAALTSSNPATAFNPFGYTFKLVPQPGNTANPYLIQVDKPFTNAAAVTEALYDNFAREGRTEIASWDAKVNGSLGDLSFLGGPIGFAAGAEWRWENYKDWRPAYAGLNPASAPYNGNPNDPNNLFYGPFENDFIALSPNLNLYSARTIIAAYSEVLVPVVAKRNRLPFVHSLDLSVAGRTERFSDFGSTTKPKYGLSWRPAAWALARASFNGSFRAPNLVQLNPSPLQRAVTGVSDPYRSTVTGLNVDSTATRTVFRQGNAGLEAETARSFTTGIVVSPPATPGLTLSADIWRIKQSNVIQAISASEQLRRDELLLDAATQKALAAGTPVASVNLGSGADSYAGNPQVRRFGITPDDVSRFATYNAGKPASQQRATVGGVAAVVTDYVNIAGRDVRGVDFGIEYRFPKKRLGQVTVRGDGSYSMKFQEEAQPGALKEDFVSRDGRARFRGNMGVTWRKDRWTAGLSTVYYGSFVDTGASTTKEVYDVLGRPEYISAYVDAGGTQRYRLLVSSWVYHNAYVNYAIGRQRGSIFSNVSTRLGVNNLTDSDPPLADETFGYRRGAGTNPRGRAFYVQVSKRL